MRISKSSLDNAINAQIISRDQANQIWDLLEKENANTPQFSFIHFAYYFGALICIAAMTWFVTLGWENFGGKGLAAISGIYGLLFFFAGRSLWLNKNLQIPGGLLITLAACMTPLFVYGLQRELNWWIWDDPGIYQDFHVWVKGGWVVMSVSTVVVSSILLKYFRFPFLTMPLAVALWYLSMDLAPVLFGASTASWNDRRWVSLWFGLAMILAAYFFDRKTKKDYSFWLYTFGLIAFWGSLSSMPSSTELSKFFYFCINMGLMFVSIFLVRKAFMVFGAIGVVGYLSHLSHRVFKDSMLFPIVLVMIGLGIIFIGIKLQKNQKHLENWVKTFLPDWLSKLRPTAKTE